MLSVLACHFGGNCSLFAGKLLLSDATSTTLGDLQARQTAQEVYGRMEGSECQGIDQSDLGD